MHPPGGSTGGIGGEREAAVRLNLVEGFQEANHVLLVEVLQLHAAPLEFLALLMTRLALCRISKLRACSVLRFTKSKCSSAFDLCSMSDHIGIWNAVPLAVLKSDDH